MKINTYTDGSYSTESNCGGYGVVICHPQGTRKYSGGKRYTTNNQMELIAVYAALMYGKRISGLQGIVINTDSSYVENMMRPEAMERYIERDWRTVTGENVKNGEIWRGIVRFLEDYKAHNISVEVRKIIGHTGNMFHDMADELAVQARKEKQEELRNER